MKTGLILTFLFSSLLGFSQSPKETPSIEDEGFNSYYQNRKDKSVIHGKILNLSSDEIRSTEISYTLVTPFEQERWQVKKTSELRPDGTFEIILDYPFPCQQVWLQAGDLFFGAVFVNTNITVELDAFKLKPDGLNFYGPGIRYSGTDGALTEYFNKYVLHERKRKSEIRNTMMNYRDGIRGKNIANHIYLKTFDSLSNLTRAIEQNYIKKNPSEHSWIITNESESEYCGWISVDHWNRRMPAELLERVKKHKAYAIGSEGMAFYNYLSSYLDGLAWKSKDQRENLKRKVRILDSLFIPAKADFLKLKHFGTSEKQLQLFQEIVLPTIRTQWCKDVIAAEIHKHNTNLASLNKKLKDSETGATQGFGKFIGELPFGAKLYQVDSITATQLLTGLKELAGKKALFIDCWATWCGPCIGEFPYSKKLHASIKDLPVEFIYLCTSDNSDINKWKAKVAEHQLIGIHVFVNKNIMNKLLAEFSSSGYPTYAFINQQGEYKPGAIERPSGMTREKVVALITP